MSRLLSIVVIAVLAAVMLVTGLVIALCIWLAIEGGIAGSGAGGIAPTWPSIAGVVVAVAVFIASGAVLWRWTFAAFGAIEIVIGAGESSVVRRIGPLCVRQRFECTQNTTVVEYRTRHLGRGCPACWGVFISADRRVDLGVVDEGFTRRWLVTVFEAAITRATACSS